MADADACPVKLRAHLEGLALLARELAALKRMLKLALSRGLPILCSVLSNHPRNRAARDALSVVAGACNQRGQRPLLRSGPEFRR